MKAIIMAGGEGTRLRPITCRMPKPAVPVKDKPVILHIIGLLEQHGIYDIAITLKYLPGELKKIVESAIPAVKSKQTFGSVRKRRRSVRPAASKTASPNAMIIRKRIFW